MNFFNETTLKIQTIFLILRQGCIEIWNRLYSSIPAQSEHDLRTPDKNDNMLVSSLISEAQQIQLAAHRL